jgi:hypothetical protein
VTGDGEVLDGGRSGQYRSFSGRVGWRLSSRMDVRREDDNGALEGGGNRRRLAQRWQSARRCAERSAGKSECASEEEKTGFSSVTPTRGDKGG